MTNLYPVITLMTDFGLRDHYVAAMKGVILSICPYAKIVDVTHQVSSYEVSEAAFLLSQTWACFPKRTVHVVVVDPGVGSMRRPILAEVEGHRFIAPDNGVLTPVLTREGCKVRHITAEKFFRHPVSQTFHGRDIFAPVAAHLSLAGVMGVASAKFGPLIENHLRLTFERPNRTARRGWTGAILHVDHFGNIVTNIPIAEFPQIQQQPFEVTIGFRTVEKLASSYAEMKSGELFAIVGSSGYLEISANQDSAARILGCETGAPVEIRLL
jgi:S-adenosylmethionine hydrolase